MNLTELIKDRDYKEHIVNTFRIPTEIVKAATEAYNENPSLTGNAFEIFFEMYLDNTKIPAEQRFRENISEANRHVQRFKAGRLLDQSKGLLFNLLEHSDFEERADKLFNKVNSIINSEFSETEKLYLCSLIQWENENKIPYLRFDSVVLYKIFSHLIKIEKDCGINLYPFNGANIIICGVDALKAFYFENLRMFLHSANKFKKSKSITTDFVSNLLYFSSISSRFFSGSPIAIEGFSPSYINYVSDLLCNCLKSGISRGRLVRKPKLHFNKVLATPDFLVDGVLYEVKTSKKTCKQDYLQAVSYLLFAQLEDNRLCYGDIQEIRLYYPLLNYRTSITLQNIGFKASHMPQLIKYIKKAKANEDAALNEKIERLKAQIQKEQTRRAKR